MEEWDNGIMERNSEGIITNILKFHFSNIPWRLKLELFWNKSHYVIDTGSV
jgi:hypothetical protein